MPKPDLEPIGLQLARVARTVGRAFDGALVAGGGSLPVWLILVSLKSQAPGAQRELAAAVGVEPATLTHHLNRMEIAGLVTRRRDPNNRRVHHVALTDQGEQLFAALRGHVAAFDAALRTGLREGDLVELRRLLDHLAANVASPRGGDGDRGTVSR